MRRERVASSSASVSSSFTYSLAGEHININKCVRHTHTSSELQQRARDYRFSGRLDALFVVDVATHERCLRNNSEWCFPFLIVTTFGKQNAQRERDSGRLMPSYLVISYKYMPILYLANIFQSISNLFWNTKHQIRPSALIWLYININFMSIDSKIRY